METGVTHVIENIGAVAARMSVYARRAWRQMVWDACIGLFLVLMLTIAGGLLVYAAFAFARTLMPDYAAAFVVAVVIGTACAVVYVVCSRAAERRPFRARPARADSVPASAVSPPPSTAAIALMAALAVTRVCGRSRSRTDG